MIIKDGIIFGKFIYFLMRSIIGSSKKPFLVLTVSYFIKLNFLLGGGKKALNTCLFPSIVFN